jgi:CpeT protein
VKTISYWLNEFGKFGANLLTPTITTDLTILTIAEFHWMRACILFSLALAFTLLTGCASTRVSTQLPTTQPPAAKVQSPADSASSGRPALATLMQWMTGTFSSADQAAADKDYLPIELRVASIWPERNDGPWLYVEQATAATPDKPYRQRVYRLVYLRDQQGDRYESRVYTLRGNPLDHAGAWKQAAPLASVSAESLVERVGCAVIMRREADGRFVGATEGESCASDLRGASYATARVWVTANEMRSWDQGFAKDGEQAKQVWGAVKGAYEFKKRSADVK